MIIVSQNKTQIVNFDNIIRIYVHKSPNEIPDVRCDTECDLEIILGDYDTEERAKEVLEEIVKEYSKCCVVYQGTVEINYLQRPKAYIMPIE